MCFFWFFLACNSPTPASSFFCFFFLFVSPNRSMAFCLVSSDASLSWLFVVAICKAASCDWQSFSTIMFFCEGSSTPTPSLVFFLSLPWTKFHLYLIPRFSLRQNLKFFTEFRVSVVCSQICPPCMKASFFKEKQIACSHFYQELNIMFISPFHTGPRNN